jgi:phosphoribosylformylglycinamidine synthase
MDRLMRRRDVPFELFDIDLPSASDADLMALSASLGLSLSLDEMKRVREYFEARGGVPSDVELQSVAQAWSEHCCYKSSKVFLREHIFGIKHPDVLAKGDAGVMIFDDEHAYALRIESHNHPSAIEPYGGAATGIGGIVRDVLCMGCRPIALIDPLFFGPIDYEGDVPAGVKSPKYLVGGVVAGIRDYGNRIGVPTVSGGLWFDPAYVGNCLVNVGCLGICKRSDLRMNQVGGVGDAMILVGGKTGRDGIHGVTFASRELKETSEDESRGSVQLGDPITKEPLIHACLEVNALGLITGMKDLGGGGLSCVVGEMALSAGCGAEVKLDLVPTKEAGLAPWEIWVSESQERMMLSASEERVPEILDLFRLWDVDATVIGKAVPGNEVTLTFKGEKVFRVDLDFLTKGPEYCRPSAAKAPSATATEVFPKLPMDFGRIVLRLLSDLNIASKEWVTKQYDHEVRGGTVIKPMSGVLMKRGPSDATMVRPLRCSTRGLAIAVGVNPWFTSLDPYRGGMASVDEACRNIIASGARPHSLTDCLNFGNPEKPERLWEFKEALAGLSHVVKEMGLAIPSGNVSLYNENSSGACLPTATVMGVGIISDVASAVTTDLKREGDPVYIVGRTRREMGGSAFFRAYGGRGGEVPDVECGMLRRCQDDLLGAMGAGLVRACHDLSDGGLAIAAAEMCLGGDIGMEMDLAGMGDMPATIKLFSESNTRWLVEVTADREMEFVHRMGVPCVKVGVVGGREFKACDGGDLFCLELDDVRRAWTAPLWDLMG